MLNENSMENDLWCPAEDSPPSANASASLDLTPGERTALSRFSRNEWMADAQVAQLQSLGLVERAFGQALLTPLGRRMLGLAD